MKSSEVAQLKSDFHRDGYVIVRDLISPEVLTELREGVQSAVQRLRPKDSMYKNHGLPQLHGNVAKGLERLDEYFKDFINDGTHVLLLEELLGEKQTPATVGYFSKELVEDEIHPHFDGDNGCTIWFALDPTDSDNGCVHFLKGSHLQFTRNVQSFSPLKSRDLFDDPNAVAAILNPGDVSIHDARTIHWSGKNTSGRPRRAVNCFYQKRSTSKSKKSVAMKDSRG